MDFHNVSKNCLAQRRRRNGNRMRADLTRLSRRYNCIHLCKQTRRSDAFFFVISPTQYSELTSENPKQENGSTEKRRDNRENGTRIVIGVSFWTRMGLRYKYDCMGGGWMEDKDQNCHTKNDIDLYGEGLKQVTWWVGGLERGFF